MVLLVSYMPLASQFFYYCKKQRISAAIAREYPDPEGDLPESQRRGFLPPAVAEMIQRRKTCGARPSPIPSGPGRLHP